MSLFDKDNAPLDDKEALAHHIATALAVPTPSGLELELPYRIVKRLFNPLIIGADNIPEQPCLFVGNHSLFALDGWVLGPVFNKELGRFVRGLGDKFLFSSPAIGERILKTGAVMGHPEVCSALMKDGRDLIVFPGGAQEAVKPTSELYELKWKERYGFVKLAAKHGYTIMPFGSVGPDEFYSHYIEGRDLPDSAPGKILKRLGLITDDFRSDIMPPLPLGALGTPFPKPQRCYVGFGEPVDLSQYKGRTPTPKQQKSIRAEVAEQIEIQLAELLFARAQNRGKDGLLRKILTL
ncbi:MAG: acyltransferase family protein [Gammaproteobacteria bacterium]|nr:acyltransferase family protein [Gammaproteobacteria bacterium]